MLKSVSFTYFAKNRWMELAIASLLVATVLLPLSSARAADPTTDNQTQVRYSKSKDGRYLYIKTPVLLDFMDRQQREALGASVKRMQEHLQFIRDKSPRNGLGGKVDQTLIEEANRFDQSLEGLVNYMQKFFGEVQPNNRAWLAGKPTGLLLFSGMDWSKDLGLSVGGSVIVGIVMVPLQVQQIAVDTGEISTFLEFDSNLIVWPSVKAGIGGNTGQRGNLIGGGLIWGRLDSATDFHGVVLGASQSGLAYMGFEWRLQALKNFSKKGAISNVFLTVGWDSGVASSIAKGNQFKWEHQGTASLIVDAGSYFGASPTQNASEIITNVGTKVIDRQREQMESAQQQQQQHN